MPGYDESRHNRNPLTGQYAAHVGAEAQGGLEDGASETAEATPAPATLLDGVPGAGTWADDYKQEVINALGPGDDLTHSEKQMLPVLLNPANNEGWVEQDASLTEILEEGRFAGYSEYDARDDENVADLLAEHYARTQPDRPYFEVGFPRDSEGAISSYSTDVYCPGLGSYLSDHHEIKYLCRNGSGLRGALTSAAILNDDWHHTLEKGGKGRPARRRRFRLRR